MDVGAAPVAVLVAAPVAASLGNTCPFLDEWKILYGGTFRGTCLRSVDRIPKHPQFSDLWGSKSTPSLLSSLSRSIVAMLLCCYGRNRIHHADWLTSSGMMGGTSAPTSMQHSIKQVASSSIFPPNQSFLLISLLRLLQLFAFYTVVSAGMRLSCRFSQACATRTSFRSVPGAVSAGLVALEGGCDS
jgi:hypothetical protein